MKNVQIGQIVYFWDEKNSWVPVGEVICLTSEFTSEVQWLSKSGTYCQACINNELLFYSKLACLEYWKELYSKKLELLSILKLCASIIARAAQ